MIPVKIIGLGLGPADLTPAMVEIINHTEILAGGKRHLSYFPDVSARKLTLESDLDAWLDRLQALTEDNQVTVLASGDPGFYGIAETIIDRLGRDAVLLFPNITAAQGAFARLKLPFQDAGIVSLHSGAENDFFIALRQFKTLAVYTSPGYTPAVIAQLMTDRGQTGWRMWVLSDMGAESEKIDSLSLAEAVQKKFSPLNMVVLEKTSETEPLGLGMGEECYVHEAGLITKAEVRAVAISKLNLLPWHTMWDLGAGCGSVGIEASLLVPKGKVVALELKTERIKNIKTNRARYGVSNMDVVQLEMPDGLADLPAPDRIFIGGGGLEISEIIRQCASYIKPGGRIVTAAVLMETVEKARKTMAELDYETEVVLIQISRSSPLADDLFLKALNPVWLICGWMKE